MLSSLAWQQLLMVLLMQLHWQLLVKLPLQPPLALGYHLCLLETVGTGLPAAALAAVAFVPAAL